MEHQYQQTRALRDIVRMANSTNYTFSMEKRPGRPRAKKQTIVDKTASQLSSQIKAANTHSDQWIAANKLQQINTQTHTHTTCMVKIANKIGIIKPIRECVCVCEFVLKTCNKLLMALSISILSNRN